MRNIVNLVTFLYGAARSFGDVAPCGAPPSRSHSAHKFALVALALSCSGQAREATPEIGPEPTSTNVPMAPGQTMPSLGYVTKTATAKCQAASRSEATIGDVTTSSTTYLAWVNTPELSLDNVVSVLAWYQRPPAAATPDLCETVGTPCATTTVLVDVPFGPSSTIPAIGRDGHSLIAGCTEYGGVAPDYEVTFRYTYTQ